MTLDEVRKNIDHLDGQLLRLLGKRQRWVEKAGHLKPKNDAQAVAAPDRVAHVIASRRAQAAEYGLSPDVAEAVGAQ